MARTFGWRVAHARPARTAKGWRTPWQYDGKGHPDLLLVRERLVFAECKAGRNTLEPEQVAWREALERSGQEWHLWTPDDWLSGDIDRVLAPVGVMWAA
jgi:hypothetical protein